MKRMLWMTGALAGIAIQGCAHRLWTQAREGEAQIRVVQGKGAGNLRLGMSKGRAGRRLGEPEGIKTFGQDESYWHYFGLGLSVKFVEGKVDSIFFYSGVRGGFERDDYSCFPGGTKEGVTPLSTSREVMEIFGKPEHRGDEDAAPIPSHWFTYDAGIGFSYLQARDQMIYMYVTEL